MERNPHTLASRLSSETEAVRANKPSRCRHCPDGTRKFNKRRRNETESNRTLSGIKDQRLREGDPIKPANRDRLHAAPISFTDNCEEEVPRKFKIYPTAICCARIKQFKSVKKICWLLLASILLVVTDVAQLARSERMVRLCIASVDPAKLSSQCVMCNRREFPLTVIDCTGITKVNDLIANPLTVQEAKCLIYNCRRQVPQIKPEPYHGSVNNAANYRGPAGASATLGSSYHRQQQQLPGLDGPAMPMAQAVGRLGPFNTVTSGSRVYEMMTPSGVIGSNHAGPGGYAGQSLGAYQQSPFSSRFGYPSSSILDIGDGYIASANTSPLGGAMRTPRGSIGGPNPLSAAGQQALPYALVPAPSTGLLPFGSRKYKAALVPLFR